MEVTKSKLLFSILFGLIVLASFVIAEGIPLPTPAPVGGGGSSSGGEINPLLEGVFCQNLPIGDLDIEINDVDVVNGFGENDNYWYPLDEVEYRSFNETVLENIKTEAELNVENTPVIVEE